MGYHRRSAVCTRSVRCSRCLRLSLCSLPLLLCSFRIYALRLRCCWYPAIRRSLDISSILRLPSTHCRTYMQPSSQLGHKTAGAARALYIMSPGSIGCEHGWICSNATKGYWAMSDR
ncbi:uncharacterized protein C8Q71DRAFT_286367 [Rhodofomes roseus]|uniref:Secreted protein n=1 Tax=Rhodofomes roseus TaxID=34475 RepID=A0ABQ8K535_9APHY|nr:uncharacterized protein C8Q71DRAFT_286367 [Rhodofomes roseus]KAH9831816.1 hypothetical protein C8Q71DRAFT_286367 [Rhodofomes roseus]